MTSINDYFFVEAEYIPLNSTGDNIEINSNFAALQPSSDLDVTGFQAPTTTEHASNFTLKNESSEFSITLKFNNVGSSPANRLIGSANDVVVAPGQYAFFRVCLKGFIFVGKS